jgi:hypothetical protein
VENTMLLRQIGQGANAQAATAAFGCALLKFAICIGALQYIAWATWNSERRPVAVVAQIVALFLLAPVVLALLA